MIDRTDTWVAGQVAVERAMAMLAGPEGPEIIALSASRRTRVEAGAHLVDDLLAAEAAGDVDTWRDLDAALCAIIEALGRVGASQGVVR